MAIINKPIRLIELFAGVGCQAQALKNLGVDFEHYRAVEFDKYPVASYNAIHGTNFAVADICDTHAEDLDICDKEHYQYLLTYSFPCQDLSIAGKGAGMKRNSGTRSGLLWEVERLLKECAECGELPDILLMENVPQVHGKKNIDDFNEWLAVLENLGYWNTWKDLNATGFGVAQNRNRCFCVSILGGKDGDFVWPEPTKLTKCMADYLDEVVDEKYYINSERAQQLIDKMIQSGQLDDYEVYRIMEKEYEYRIRKLTPKECWRLMGWDDESFHKAEAVNSNTQLYKQAGNGIVVPVLEAIFAQML